MVRKIGAPGHEELAIGAIASAAAEVLNEPLIQPVATQRPRTSPARPSAAHRQLAEREARLRGARPFPDLAEDG